MVEMGCCATPARMASEGLLEELVSKGEGADPLIVWEVAIQMGWADHVKT